MKCMLKYGMAVGAFASACFAIFGFAGSAFADVTIPLEAAWPEPIYAIEVASGTASLSTVSISKTEGGSTTVISGLPAATATGTIVKTGAGELTHDVKLASFKGQIHLQEGLIRATVANALGLASSTTYVYQASTLITDNSQSGMTGNANLPNTVFFAGGAGFAGQYGQYVMIKGSNIRAPFVGRAILGADTTWNIRSNICWDGNKVVDFQGHVLTLKDVDSDKDATLYVDAVLTENPGGIVIDGMKCFNIRNVGANSFTGNGYFKFINGANVKFGEAFRVKQPMDWKLILTDNTDLLVARAGHSTYGALTNLPNTTYMTFGGLELKEKDLVLYDTSTQKGYTDRYSPLAIMGPFIGSYGITYASAKSACKQWAITLGSPNNTFTGGVKLYEDCRLDLLGGGNALPANGGNLEMATGAVLGFGEGAYTLPGALFKGSGIVSNTAATAATGSWTKPVVKTGADTTLDYGVSVGGTELDVREGTVRLAQAPYSSVAGLNKGRKWFANRYMAGKDADTYYYGDSEPEMDSDWNDNSINGYSNQVRQVWVPEGFSWDDSTYKYKAAFACSDCWTNTTADSIDIAFEAKTYKKHPRYHVFTYTGYIWNDSADYVNWTVASAFNDHQIWKLNGGVIYTMDDKRIASDIPDRALITLTLQPGPNAIEVRTYSEFVSTPNFYACATNGFRDATIDFGMGYAKSVTESDTVADYLPFRDDGTGSLFTRETTLTRTSFDKAKVAAGATLDLNAGARANYITTVFEVVEGAGTISHGIAKITESLNVVTNGVGAIAPLTVDGKLVFGPGAVVKFAEGVEPVRASGKTATVCVQATAIEGTPMLDPALADTWQLINDGTTLSLLRRHPGFYLMFR